MPLKRQTFGTQSVIHRLAITVRQELAEMPAANGTFHLVSNVERTHQQTEQITQFDEPLAGEDFSKEGD